MYLFMHSYYLHKYDWLSHLPIRGASTSKPHPQICPFKKRLTQQQHKDTATQNLFPIYGRIFPSPVLLFNMRSQTII